VRRFAAFLGGIPEALFKCDREEEKACLYRPGREVFLHASYVAPQCTDHVHTHAHTHTHTHTHTRAHTCRHTHAHTHPHTHPHTRTHIHTRTHTHTNLQALTHTHTHTHSHSHTHTQAAMAQGGDLLSGISGLKDLGLAGLQEWGGLNQAPAGPPNSHDPHTSSKPGGLSSGGRTWGKCGSGRGGGVGGRGSGRGSGGGLSGSGWGVGRGRPRGAVASLPYTPVSLTVPAIAPPPLTSASPPQEGQPLPARLPTTVVMPAGRCGFERHTACVLAVWC
jgi:hypothetical protein